MSTMVGLRSLSRSVRVRVGGKVLSPNTTVLINIDSGRVKRDLNRHSTLGSFIQTASPFVQNDDGTVVLGGKVTTRATGLVVDVSAVKFTRASGTIVNGAVGTATVGAADITNPRVDTVVVDTTAGTYSVIAGTATAGATTFNLTGRGAVPANRIVLAYIVVPATATNLTQSAVVDSRP